jgi:hypothetical protein
LSPPDYLTLANSDEPHETTNKHFGSKIDVGGIEINFYSEAKASIGIFGCNARNGSIATVGVLIG